MGDFRILEGALMSRSETWVVQLDERDLSCIRWAVPIIRGVEEGFGEQAGTREGEAMSDVLAAIVARAELLKDDER